MEQDEPEGDFRHTPSGRWLLGFALSLIATAFWGTVPIALSLLLDQMDAITITWYRFTAGAVVLGIILRLRSSLPDPDTLLSGWNPVLLLIAGVGLTANFVVYLYALNFIPPGASQVVMNLSPIFVLAGGVILFREPFRRVQSGGVLLLVLGFLLFFNQRFHEFSGELSEYAYGALLVLSAAVIWSAYALAQKQLLKACSSPGLMLIFYGTGVVIMLPFSSLDQISGLTPQKWIVLAYASANTLIAYGCFAEALQHWEASRVSMVVSMTPLLTLLLSHPAHKLWPDRIMPDELNSLGIIGAVLAVSGSMLASLGGRRSNRD